MHPLLQREVFKKQLKMSVHGRERGKLDEGAAARPTGAAASPGGLERASLLSSLVQCRAPAKLYFRRIMIAFKSNYNTLILGQ